MLKKSFLRWSMTTSFAVALLLGAIAFAADAPKDDKSPQGAWTLTSGEADGKALTPVEIKDGKLEIKGNDYTVTLAGKETVTGTQKLDTTKTPMAIDITDATGPNKGKTCQGIYELQDNQFRVVFAQPGKPRPTKFATTAGTGEWMHVWKPAK